MVAIKKPNWELNIRNFDCFIQFSASYICESKGGLRNLVGSALPKLKFKVKYVVDPHYIMVVERMGRLDREKKAKKYWVHPLWNERLLSGKFYTMFYKFREYPNKVFRYFRMSVRSFDELLRTLGPALTYKNTNMRLSQLKKD
ncbi:unnamed protein product [Parnassius mnemosyne]|uniref:Uncharacterized protein n=1 Tax=Parnassius mnemosyne TaxID=213953 RepID=A0AAV1M7I7_9NEOP